MTVAAGTTVTVAALWQYLDSRTRPPLTPSQTAVPGLEQRLEDIYSYGNVFFAKWSALMLECVCFPYLSVTYN